MSVLLEKAVEHLPQIVDVVTHISRIAFGAETAEELEKIKSQDNIHFLVSTDDLQTRITESVNEENWPRLIAFLEDDLPSILDAGDVPERLLRDIKESQSHIISELKSLGFRSLSERLPLGERESGTEPLDQAVSAYHAALEELTRVRESGAEWLEERVSDYRAALEAVTRGGERGGVGGLPRGTGGGDATPTKAARVGEYRQKARHHALDAQRAADRDGAPRAGGGGLPCGAGGIHARTGAAQLGDDAEQPRHRALQARRVGERNGAAGGGGCGLQCVPNGYRDGLAGRMGAASALPS